VARNSVKIGIIMLFMWVIPIFGFVLAAAGLIFGINSYSVSKDAMARSGIFLNSLGLGLSLLNITVSVYLFISGDFDFLPLLEQLNQPIR